MQLDRSDGIEYGSLIIDEISFRDSGNNVIRVVLAVERNLTSFKLSFILLFTVENLERPASRILRYLIKFLLVVASPQHDDSVLACNCRSKCESSKDHCIRSCCTEFQIHGKLEFRSR